MKARFNHGLIKEQFQQNEEQHSITHPYYPDRSTGHILLTLQNSSMREKA